MNRIFFFNDTATTEIYTLSLHDALPICAVDDPAVVGEDLGQHAGEHDQQQGEPAAEDHGPADHPPRRRPRACGDRKSTRLNSSHANISYAVFCLKKKTIFPTGGSQPYRP